MLAISVPEAEVRGYQQDPPSPKIEQAPVLLSVRFDRDHLRNELEASSTRSTRASFDGDQDRPLKSPWRTLMETLCRIVGGFVFVSIVASVALATLATNLLNTADSLIIVVGSTFSIVGSSAMLSTALCMSSKDLDSFALILSAASADFIQAIFYFSVSISGLLEDSNATVGTRCVASCFSAQFIWFAVNCWGFALSANSFFTFACPISYGKTSKKFLGWYHLLCWGLGFASACIGNFAGSPQVSAVDSYCWVSSIYGLGLYDYPTLATVAIQLGFIVYIAAHVSRRPGKRMQPVNLNALSTLIWITRVTIAYLATNVWYFPLDLGATGTPGWTAVVGDLFSAFQGFANFLLWFPKIWHTLSKRRKVEAFNKAKDVVGSFAGGRYNLKHKMGFYSDHEANHRFISNPMVRLEVVKGPPNTNHTCRTEDGTPSAVDEERVRYEF